jgi:protein TonB
MQQPVGMQRMVAVSLVVHAVLLVTVFLAPKGFLTGDRETRSVMTISLGEGSGGPPTGGITAMGGRPVQAQTPPDEAPKREAVRPPAAKAPEMTVPLPDKKPVKASPTPPVKQAPDEARGRTPTKGAEVREGSAVAETGARGQGFGGLSTGGGAGSGMMLDVADFCCPDYLVTMQQRLKSNWDERAAEGGIVSVRFTILRDGTLSKIEVARSSGNPLADNAAARAVILTRQLPPLPAQFPNPTLTVNLFFQYTK